MGTRRYRGVRRKGEAWEASIHYNGHRHHIGTFVTEEAAARAYDAECRLRRPRAPHVNFPRPGEPAAKRKHPDSAIWEAAKRRNGATTQAAPEIGRASCRERV